MVALLRVVLVLLGCAVVTTTVASVVRTLIVPRGLTSRMTRVIDRTVRAVFKGVARRIDDLDRRDALLVLHGPVTLVAVLVGWVVLLVAGFALVLVGATGIGAGAAVREAGSSLFTLGFASSHGFVPALVAFVAAGTGLVVVALQIAYLPTLYGAFNRRETLVTLLQSRAGSPSWGPELLARQQIVGLVDTLPGLYADWEGWAADLAETHTNYPILVYFRSPKAHRSWVVALLAVLDSAALFLALSPQRAPSQARLCLRMGFVSLREVCTAAGIAFDPDPSPEDPIELTYEEFLVGVERLRSVGFDMERTPAQAWPHFRGWRVNYEAMVYALVREVDAVPAYWSGPRDRSVEQIAPYRPPDRQPKQPD